MKKIGVALLFLCCFFALLLELTGSDPDHTWSVRGYVTYVTNNMQPLPRIDIPRNGINSIKDFMDMLGKIFVFVWDFVCICLDNILVLFNGLLPFRLVVQGGSGFGGGGGGAR